MKTPYYKYWQTVYKVSKAEKKTFPISFIWTNISLLRVNVQFK